MFCEGKSKEGGIGQLPNQHIIDSLLTELRNYEAEKVKSGKNTPDIADTIEAILYKKLFRNYSRYDNAIAEDYAQKSLSISEKIGYKKGIANGYESLGMINDNKGEYSKAIEYYKRSYTVSKKIDNRSGEMSSFANIGIIYTKQGNFPEALQYILAGLKMAEEIKDTVAIANAYNGIGIIYKQQKNYDEAIKNYFKCLDVGIMLKNNYIISAIYSNIGELYLNQKKWDKAMEYLLLGLKLAEEMKIKSIAANDYQNIGTIYFQQNEFEKAMENFNISLKLSEELNDKDGVSKTSIYLGDTYFKQGNTKMALPYIINGLAIAKEIGELQWMKNAYRSLAAIYDTIGDYQQAYKNHVLFKTINDSLFNTEQSKKLIETQMQFDFDKKEALAKEAEQKQSTFRNYIYIVITIVFLFLIMLIIQRTKIAKERRKIALEQERSRISRDLHDDLGSGLTGILMMSEQLQTSNKESTDQGIEKIKKSSRQMVDQMGEIVWAMNVKNDTLENLISYVNTYLLDSFEDSAIKLKVILPETIPDFELNGMVRRNIFLVVKESLNNMLKYANATEVNFKMMIKDNKMLIELSDNGKGFELDKTRRFGNGLKNMKSRMDDIKGNFIIESEIDKGTKTNINFPLA